jgi:hypothetical protein
VDLRACNSNAAGEGSQVDGAHEPASQNGFGFLDGYAYMHAKKGPPPLEFPRASLSLP